MTHEQKMLDITFEIAMMLHDKERSKPLHNMSREELAEWIRRQFTESGIEVVGPIGSSWGVLTRKR